MKKNQECKLLKNNTYSCLEKYGCFEKKAPVFFRKSSRIFGGLLPTSFLGVKNDEKTGIGIFLI